MRVLVTGAAGQLGVDLVRHCRAVGDDVTAADRAQLDVADRSAVHGAISTLRPEIVVNVAAWTAVDACEGDHERARRVNTLGPRWLREATSDVGAHLVQLSTDYVFDGTLDRPYHEWDDPNPQSVYGATKLAGEREAGADATVVRTSWVCGANGNNMVKTILRMLPERRSFTFVDDQRGCPTFTADLAPMVRRLAIERRAGVYHVTNQGAVSWFEFVQSIVAEAGHDPAIVEPIATADLDPPRPASRPANSVLDNAALRLADVPLLRHHREPLRELVSHLLG
ncbi:MAG: dTDP-4-dehydrorhamnose reductase [Ilumatobacter sp.]|nr:dTDP-4-dehydrorhamnose reductase [Ilumatobacter sp.]